MGGGGVVYIELLFVFDIIGNVLKLYLPSSHEDSAWRDFGAAPGGVEIWRTCGRVVCMQPASNEPPGVLGRLLPCRIHCPLSSSAPWVRTVWSRSSFSSQGVW